MDPSFSHAFLQNPGSGFIDADRRKLYRDYKFLLSMLWQAPGALTRGRRLLSTLLHAARQAQRDLTRCHIRVGNPALQAKVLWTEAGDELLRWLGFELPEGGEPTYPCRGVSV